MFAMHLDFSTYPRPSDWPAFPPLLECPFSGEPRDHSWTPVPMIVRTVAGACQISSLGEMLPATSKLSASSLARPESIK